MERLDFLASSGGQLDFFGPVCPMIMIELIFLSPPLASYPSTPKTGKKRKNSCQFVMKFADL